MDDEHKVTTQRNDEASLRCLKKASPYNFQEIGNALDDFSGIKEDKNNNPSLALDHSMTREAPGPVYQGCNRPFYQQEVSTWPNLYGDVRMMQQGCVNSFDNRFYTMSQEYLYPVENRFQYMPFLMVPQGYSHEVQFQEFQYFVVIDFEATCDKDKNIHPQEIIEFPSVLVNSLTGQLEASFQTYIRPAYHQLLTDFCKELTGIQQIQVDRGVSLSEALLMHDKWLEQKGIKHKNFAVVTWGNWDCHMMLDSECRLKGIRKPPYFNRWINLKDPFQEVFGIRCNLKDAVQLSGLVWEGRPHCGLDDACNTARLLVLLMHRGFHFSITNTLTWCSPENPLTGTDRHVDSATHQLQKPKESTGRGLQLHPVMDPTERTIYCFCGVKGSKCVVRKPGPNHGRWFFGCGNWSASRRAVCDYFVWASP